MSTTKKKSPPTKTPAKKAAKSPAKTAKKAVAKAKAKTTRTLKPKPRATRTQKRDVGLFGSLQKNIQEGLSVITETILPSAKKSSRRK
jgi:hypothetical protein